jgi:DNA-directed RNA polymerase subunit RPC12/RpoP
VGAFHFCGKRERIGEKPGQEEGQMKETEQERKETVLHEVEEVVDQLFTWEKDHPRPTLSEIEQVVLQLRQKLGQRMAEIVLEAQEGNRPVPGPSCAQCGQEMRYKGQKEKTIESLVGSLDLERGYYTCPGCGERIFPPRSATGAEGSAVE